jgi:succinoglycan biosynthesis transport protein ExoP
MLDVVLKGHLGGSDFIPAGSVDANISPGELVLSSNFALLVSMVRGHYDYVIVDLPPLHYAADALAVAPHMDMFLYIVGWGETPESIIRSSLESSLPVKKKLAGAVLNKVDVMFMMKMTPVSKGYAELAGYYS